MMQQGTPEWHAARLGKVTASRVADVIATAKTGYAASRANYMAELALEILTGQRQEGFTNAAMQWGTATEPMARAAYESARNVFVVEVGLIDHPSIDMAGASPDGLVGDVGLLEIKCPNSATHIQTLRSKAPDGKYITQMQWQMACTERHWCDFVSFDPRMPDGLQLYIQRIDRDSKVIEQLEAEVKKFRKELDALIAELMQMKEVA